MRLTVFVMFLCIAFVSCDSGVEGNPLGIQPADDGIRLQNLSNRSLYYIAFEREASGRIDWDACKRPLECDHVKPGATTTIPYSSIFGYAPGKEVVIFWWHLQPTDAGTYKAMNMTNAVVKP